MEVHAHTHTARKKWTHYFWEFLMLFLAVYCGFLAENIREHQVERTREKQFIRGLVEDLAEDTSTLSNIVTELDQNVQRMDSLMQILASPDIQQYGGDLYYLGRRGSRGNRVALHDFTIQQMKNSGGFRLIRKEIVSKSIIKYYNQLSFIEMLQGIELSELEEYRKIAIDIFDPDIFDDLVKPDNNIIKPAGNPSLMTYDQAVLRRLSGMTSYVKNTRLALRKADDEMFRSGQQLIGLLKKEYHLK